MKSLHITVVVCAVAILAGIFVARYSLNDALAFATDDRQLAAQIEDMNKRMGELEKSNAQLQRSLDEVIAANAAEARRALAYGPNTSR